MSKNIKKSNPNLATRKSMQSNRDRDTKIEILLRQALWKANLRGYRKNYSKLSGRPDIVFTKKKLVIFVHGCFWHQCPNCSRNLSPKRNKSFWENKFLTNKARDERIQKKLTEEGWQVVILWECELKANLQLCIQKIKDFLLERD